MTPELRKFIKSNGRMSPAAIDDFTGKFQRRPLKKNDMLLRPGEVCQELLFVQSGCLRMYYLAPDGLAVSLWFALPGYLTSELTSFLSGQPADYAVEAIADSEVLYLPKETLYELYDVYPTLSDMMRNIWEYVILNVIRRFTSLQQDSAEQRYRDLMRRQPDYLQLIPQKYLASFLGVTPSSLSRIRRKLAAEH
ncbi:Crp/Fnr family transcriptional regulator [Hymenobacter volaticus]|uniref:Crp/Fnr family transcriptional regulator n=1 Tax=Hymenobacter volaticus TaxID=2932254 RepID=A0ABY4G2I6_9BACT|nr:Crp/Fnr family transcriptional regulator [Hymenobacter volaticus]UOQ65000.1 Crp/Fnr family transcriptional regulator [Hymenobacter volaticus]